VVGLDNVNDYYSVQLKRDRLAQLLAMADFSAAEQDLEDGEALRRLFAAHRFDAVINLAAQAGVRYSLENPHAYISSNMNGFMNILECCRHAQTPQLIYASSSSVYGMNTRMPFSVHDNVDHPVSLVRGDQESQRADGPHLLAPVRAADHGPALLHGLRPLGPTGHGPVPVHRAILADEPIKVFNEGRMQRDFTYIDDIVEGIVRLLGKPATPNADWSSPMRRTRAAAARPTACSISATTSRWR
jgi:UDP-glucuronate 4-epimerase